MELASHLLNSPDPDDRRLLPLLQRDARREFEPGYDQKRLEKSAKLDLDYDPHGGDHDYDDDDDDDEDDDDEDFSDLEESLGKMSQPELIEVLNRILGSTGFPIPGGRKNSPSKPFRR